MNPENYSILIITKYLASNVMLMVVEAIRKVDLVWMHRENLDNVQKSLLLLYILVLLLRQNLLMNLLHLEFMKLFIRIRFYSKRYKRTNYIQSSKVLRVPCNL